MNEEYAIERKKIIKKFLIMLIVLAVFFCGISALCIRNIKKYADGPKDLPTIDISKSKGDLVKLSFDKIGVPFAQYVTKYKDKDMEFPESRFYFHIVNGKSLIVEVPGNKFFDFDQLMQSSRSGEITVDNPIECKGKLISIKSELKKFAKDFLAKKLNVETVNDEEFDQYVWPYAMTLAVPKESAKDSSIGFIKSSAYFVLFIALINILTTFFSLSKLKRKYMRN